MIRIQDARFISSSSDMMSMPGPECVEIAFAGRSNVGKSSLINKLVQRKNLVRTSRTPGATRTINLFRIELLEPHAITLQFADLPGYGFAKRAHHERSAWKKLIESYLTTRAGLHTVVIAVDVRRGVEEDDTQLLEYLKAHHRKTYLVATKLDLLPLNQRKIQLKKLQTFAKVPVIGFSAQSGEGSEAVWLRLLSDFTP